MNYYINYFKPYIHYSIYVICAVSYAISIDISMLDDGLRHIAFSAYKDIMLSWGNIYPNSLFTNYDPWFGWHFLLEILLKIIPYDIIHIVINSLSLFLLMILTHLHISKNSKYNFSSLLYIIVFIIVMWTSFRYIMVRPDLLSGLYIMAALLLSNKFRYIFLLTVIYGPFYYLFFMYTGSIGLVYLVQQKYRAFWGVVISSLVVIGIFLYHDYTGYITTVINILTDQQLRMGLVVNEGKALIEIFRYFDYYILVPFFLISSGLIIWWKYNYFKSNEIATFLLITSLLWINQLRYYHLFLPLIYIYIFILLTALDKRKILRQLEKYFIIGKKYFNYSKNKPLFYIIAIPYAIFILSYEFSDKSLNKLVEKGKMYENRIFDNKVVLFNKMDIEMFRAHYYNQKMKIIPSCSIGWFEKENKEVKDIYIRLQSLGKTVTEEELKKLIKYTNTDFYIHFFMNEKQEFDFKKLINLGIIPISIKQNKVIFKVEK